MTAQYFLSGEYETAFNYSLLLSEIAIDYISIHMVIHFLETTKRY